MDKASCYQVRLFAKHKTYIHKTGKNRNIIVLINQLPLNILNIYFICIQLNINIKN